jgi:hypothetical protein
MSSTYRPICLSHDPALVIDREIRYDTIDQFNNRDGLDGHQTCDIAIGRFSYPLIEVACLGRQLPGPTGCKTHHGGTEWVDADWLRLLHAARPTADSDLLRRHTFGCWPPERLHRLRNELALPEIGVLPDRARETLQEVLAHFTKVSGPDDPTPIAYFIKGAIDPADYQRWQAAVGASNTPKEPTR